MALAMVKAVLAVMRESGSEGMTMVVVALEMGFARDVAYRVMLMDGGVIVEDGPPEHVIGNHEQEPTERFVAGIRLAEAFLPPQPGCGDNT